MARKIFTILLIGIAITTCMWACDCSENNDRNLIDVITEYKLPKHLKEKSELPLWMMERITSVENSNFYGIMSVVQFKWKDTTFFTFYSGYAPPLYEIYDEAGKKTELNDNERNECIQDSKEWMCIYYYSTLNNN